VTGSGTADGPTRLCLPCLICRKELQPVWPDTARDGARVNPDPPRGQPLSAVTFQGEPGYGSQFDTELPGPFEINICDGCLADAGKRGLVNWVRVIRTTRSSHYRWQPDQPRRGT
jgi:hypothetical protein